MRKTSLEVLEGRIGYHFKNKYLLECALTHTSFANEQKVHRYKDYERLEFLGDAILEMVSSAFLYNEYPDKREGELTKISLLWRIVPGRSVYPSISAWERARRPVAEDRKSRSCVTSSKQ